LRGENPSRRNRFAVSRLRTSHPKTKPVVRSGSAGIVPERAGPEKNDLVGKGPAGNARASIDPRSNVRGAMSGGEIVLAGREARVVSQACRDQARGDHGDPDPGGRVVEVDGRRDRAVENAPGETRAVLRNRALEENSNAVVLDPHGIECDGAEESKALAGIQICDRIVWRAIYSSSAPLGLAFERALLAGLGESSSPVRLARAR